MLAFPVHLHAHFQYVRGIGNRRGDGTGSSSAHYVAPYALAAILVDQQTPLVGQLLEGVVGSKLNRAVGGLAQNGWPNAVGGLMDALLSVLSETKSNGLAAGQSLPAKHLIKSASIQGFIFGLP